MKEKLLNAIANWKDYDEKEVMDDDLCYSITGEGPWFTNSQFGGHLFLDGDVSKMNILGEINGERILYEEVNLNDYFGKVNIKDVFNYINEDWYVESLKENISNLEKLNEWFNKNNKDNIVVLDGRKFEFEDDDINIGFIFYKKDGDIYCGTYANVEEMIAYNEMNNDNFNNALALKK